MATYWDPVSGTYKEGEPPTRPDDPSVKPGGSTNVYDRGAADPRQWGGYGRAIGADGRSLVGTSGGEKDVARYRQMGAARDAAPVIDQTRSNETRGIQDRALGYLGSAAMGQGLLSRRLGEQRLAADLNAGRSLAAGVRGGAAARAATMERVNQEAGGVAARSRMATDAAAAAEQAGARGAYMSGTTNQRAQDLGLASSQAGLEIGQRTADDQREGFYEGLGWDTANAQLETGLGVSRSDQAAGAAARSTAQSAAERSAQATRDMIGTVAGGTTGLMQGAAAAASPKKPDDRYGMSDVKSKTGIDKVESLKRRAMDAIAQTKAGIDAGPYIGKSEMDDMAKKRGLDDAIGKRVDDDLAPRYGYFDDNQKPTPPDWLASYMNSREQGDSMPSDDKTKLAKAWDEGHAAAIADVEKASREDPKTIKSRSEGDDYHPAYAAVRDIKRRAWDEGQKEGNVAARMAETRRRFEEQAPGQAAAQDARVAAATAPKAPAPPPPVPVAQQAPSLAAPGGYISQMLSRARTALSDERTKESSGYQPGQLASAMRSMKPSVYEYKPEYAGRAGQERGEKNVGPMANNMERDPVASVAIERQPDGMLAIDKDKALKLSLGGLADLQMQIDQLKRRKAS